MAKKKRFGHKPNKGKDSRIASLKKQQAKSRDDDLVDETEDDDNHNHHANGATNHFSRKRPRIRGRGDSGKLLLDDNKIQQDTKLISRAIRNKWGIRRKSMIRRRLEEILEKEEVPILTKAGLFQSEEAADKNATAAARVLVQMNGQDQADDHMQQKSNVPGTIVNVNVDTRRSRILQLADKFGAGRVIIDGRAIPSAKLAGGIPQTGRVSPTPRE